MSDSIDAESRGLWLTIADRSPLTPFPGVEIWSVTDDPLMLCCVRLAPGAVIPSHHHANLQAGTVIEGRLRFTIVDETHDVGPGQGYLIPANSTHSAVAGPDGSLVVEVFTPPREGYRMNLTAGNEPSGHPKERRSGNDSA